MNEPTTTFVQSDDAIRKFQGRMVSINGWQLPFAIRYVSWGLFLIVFPLVLLIDWFLTGTISQLPLIDLIIAGFLTWRIANATTGETGLDHALIHAARIARAVINTRRRVRSTTTGDRVFARRRHPNIQRKTRREAR